MSPRVKIVCGIASGAAVAMLAAFIIAKVEISRHARDWVDDWLTQEYKSDVDLQAFRLSMSYPLVQAEGDALVLHFQGRQDLPPLLAVRHFSLRTSFWGFLKHPRQVDYVHLDGLRLNIPPRGENKWAGRSGIKKAMGKFRSVRFGEIVSENAKLTILTNKPGKDPLEFDIEHLNLHSSTADGGLIFRATLTNPTPPGLILSEGTFGPWNSETPSLTPVSGAYTFENADLGVFRGISGILSSKGNYKGVLEEIHVRGTTDTPDFQIDRAGHRVDLSTIFDATVDGTNGDTQLHPVEVHFRKTTLLAQGTVEKTAGRNGKTITLDVNAEKASIEDFMQFAIREPATMTGPIRLKTKFILTPGPQEIPDRLYLNGSFGLEAAHFTNSAVQQKLDNMSKRSLGRPKEVDTSQIANPTDDVASSMKGNFRLERGTLTVSRVAFQIPGADVRINGLYSLGEENLDFHGVVELQAKLSQTVTGPKSFFLKVADPFFSKNGKGAVLPIKITGPLKHPVYGLDRGHKDEMENAAK